MYRICLLITFSSMTAIRVGMKLGQGQSQASNVMISSVEHGWTINGHSQWLRHWRHSISKIIIPDVSKKERTSMFISCRKGLVDLLNDLKWVLTWTHCALKRIKYLAHLKNSEQFAARVLLNHAICHSPWVKQWQSSYEASFSLYCDGHLSVSCQEACRAAWLCLLCQAALTVPRIQSRLGIVDRTAETIVHLRDITWPIASRIVSDITRISQRHCSQYPNPTEQPCVPMFSKQFATCS